MSWTRIVIGIAAIFVVGGIIAVLKFWNNIADWMIRSVLPWFKDNLPNLESLVREVFKKIDEVVTPIIQRLRQDWGNLKQWFIGQLVYFERKTSNVYIQKVCSYFRKELETKETEEYIVTKEINPIDIPAEFREKVIGYIHSKVNTTEHAEEAIKKFEEELSIST
jgi:hypothetical protein